MNELLEQFLIECRELVQRGTEDLLALERSPRDKPLIDSIFRGFHTLKGAAGIVEFPAMSWALHAAEDILAAVRAGDRPVSGGLIGDCLACLDQVAVWLDQIEAEDGVPATPDAAADALLARFGQAEFGAAEAVPTPSPTGWLEDFLARHPGRRDRARVAFRYTPVGDCFFRGEDPVALVTGLPDILALEIAAARPWPALDAFDPFECNLIITVLSAGSADDAATALRAVAGQVDVRPLDRPPLPAATVLPPEAHAVLEEQALMVLNDAAEGFAGRLHAALTVAANVLLAVGREADIPALDRALDQTERTGDAGPFAAAIRSLFSPPATPAAIEPQAPPPAAVRALRVDVERIDTLVALAGELTVAKNAVGHAARLAQEGVEPAALARLLKEQHALLDRLVGELRQSVLSIRVLPLSHVFQRFPRLVREISHAVGKSVRLVAEGETTEADKAIVEALFEPLLHVLRNALDHGVEPEDERRAAGKSPTACIRISAERNGDQVVIEVADDGRGIDLAKVRLIAARRDVASAEALSEMTDAAVAELTFAPGFSTASTVTDVSGRGVGLDAVRSAVTRLGGTVALTSRPGQGTTVRVVVPFSVMMVQVMTVEAGGQLFGIPIDAVIETVRMPRDRISRVGAAEAVVLRDRTVPLLRLSETLNLPPECDDRSEVASLVVVTVAGQAGALEVDGFGERMDVMLKPMEGLLAGMGDFAGTTLLGDGRVLIVLDLRELLR